MFFKIKLFVTRTLEDINIKQEIPFIQDQKLVNLLFPNKMEYYLVHNANQLYHECAPAVTTKEECQNYMNSIHATD